MKAKLLLLVLETSVLAAGAFGQYVRVNPDTPGYGTDVFYGAGYDQKTVVTIKAKIKGISKTPGTKPGEAADESLLIMRFDMAPDRYGKSRMIFSEGFQSVELGPAWFVQDQTAKLRVNDYVEITGSRMSLYGKPVVVAEWVRHGHDVLALRRLNGQPYWYANKPQPKAGPVTFTAPDVVPNPPARQEPAAGADYEFGASLIYGNAYSIAPPGSIQARNDLRPIQSTMMNPVIIMGNYWSGPGGYSSFTRF